MGKVETKGPVTHHQKIAANRGTKWRKNVVAGRLDAALNPSYMRISRLQKKLGQSDVAEKLGLSDSGYAAIERGKQPVKKPRALSIAKILRVDMNKLFVSSGKGKFVASIKRQSL